MKKRKNSKIQKTKKLFILIFVFFLLLPITFFAIKYLPKLKKIYLINKEYLKIDKNLLKDFKIEKDTIFDSGEYHFRNFIIKSGKITVKEESKGYLIIKAAETIVIDSNSSIDLTGKGHLGLTPKEKENYENAGINFDFAGGGGTHGGKGGSGGCGLKNYKKEYGYQNIDISFGEGGGIGTKISDGRGGNGGGYIKLVAPKIIINGKLIANGQAGEKTGGGGAGGKIVLISKEIQLNGEILAKGGTGGTYQFQGAGGGGGGVIISNQELDNSKINISGGEAGKAIDYYSGCNGEAGYEGKILFLNNFFKISIL